MTRRSLASALGAAWLAVLGPAGAWADPCGMVPPVYIQQPDAIARIGDQMTFVFYKDGVETFVIRPGFRGKVEEFGMLIPFPTPPAVRKVPDAIFQHIQAAIDPPEVVVDLSPRHEFMMRARGGVKAAAAAPGLALQKDQVRVIREEAVGMYEVAVLEAGSAAALKRWMTEHKYRYPEGMDKVCDEYIRQGWCFVAVKTRVSGKRQVDPRPGQRQVKPGLPPGAGFDGFVQAMGFRFRTPELVVPMRLSAYNQGELHNIVYLLTQGPRKIRSIPEEYVVRQVPGKQLLRNLTRPLPLRIIGGTEEDIPPWRLKQLPQERNPEPHNGHARDLFAGDLLAVASGQLSLAHEEEEKMLLRIGERLHLRGPQIDQLNLAAIRKQRQAAVGSALKDLERMTLTVIDGDFPRQVLASQNLVFSRYRMPAYRNSPRYYDAKLKAPAPRREGVLKLGRLDVEELLRRHDRSRLRWKALLSVFTLLGLVCTGVVLWRRLGGGATALLVGAVLCGAAVPAAAQQAAGEVDEEAILALIDQLEDAKKVEAAVEQLVKIGQPAVPHLLGEALEGSSMVRRGWAIVALGEIGGQEAKTRLEELLRDPRQPPLVRTWAAAARINMARDTKELLSLARLTNQFPAVRRTLGVRLVEELNAQEKPVSVDQLLAIAIRVPQLQGTLAPMILRREVSELVHTMATHSDQNVRRMAAAYLATKVQRDAKLYQQVAQAVLQTYKFDPQADRLPWQGGPLFIPALRWEKDDARALAGTLVRWYLWCEHNGRQNDLRPLENNLRSVQLARAAGYEPFGRRAPGAVGWLQTWGQVVGRPGIRQILEEQGLLQSGTYRRVLQQVPAQPKP